MIVNCKNCGTRLAFVSNDELYVAVEPCANCSQKGNLPAEYLQLVSRVREIDSAAAYYMVAEATRLGDFEPCYSLEQSFAWGDTPQGHCYWEDIHKQLEATEK